MSRWIAPILAAFVATGAVAQTSDSSDPIQTQDGIRYDCTGVGASSREDPRWQAFAAKLVFAAKNGGYLHDVTTLVTNAEGKTVFSTTCGPCCSWTYRPAGMMSPRRRATTRGRGMTAGRHYPSEVESRPRPSSDSQAFLGEALELKVERVS